MSVTHPELKGDLAENPGPRLGEFDCVRLLEAIPASASVMWLDDDMTADSIPAGSTGTIVDIPSEGVFMVEFDEPMPALATVSGNQIERL